MLRWRLLAAAGIILPLLGLLALDRYGNFGIPGIWLVPLGWLIVLLAAGETLALFQGGGYRPAAWTVYLGASLVFLSGCGSGLAGLLGYPGAGASLAGWNWPLAAMGAALMLAFLGEMARYREPGQSIVHVALAWLAVAYAGLLMCFVAELRYFRSNGWGMAALISLVWVVKMADTGAYTIGRLLGKTKLSPHLSPGKTVEGALGGFAFAAIASWCFFAFVAPWIAGQPAPQTPPWWGCWIYGLLVAIAGMIGDLAESLLKRDMKRKDSSRWLPGLGGVLDVIDSVLMAAPVAWWCWRTGLVG